MRWIVLLNVAVALLVVAGTMGRNVCLARARKFLAAGLWATWAEELSFAGSGEWVVADFTNPLCGAVPGADGLLAARPPFDAALAEAKSQGAITPPLTKVFRDSWVTVAGLPNGSSCC